MQSGTYLEQGKVLYMLSPKLDTYSTVTYLAWPTYLPPTPFTHNQRLGTVTWGGGEAPLCLVIRKREDEKPPNSWLFRVFSVIFLFLLFPLLLVFSLPFFLRT